MLGEQPVEQRGVAVLERRQPDVALEGVVLAAQVLELELHLLLDRQDPVRQQAAEEERLALRDRERQVLGQQPAAEQRRAGQRDARRTAGGDVVVRGGERAHPGEDSPRDPGERTGPGSVVRPGRPGPVPTIP